MKQNTFDACWWAERYEPFSKDRATVVTRVARDIWESQSFRRAQWLRSARLYGDENISGLGPRGYANVSGAAKLAFNVISSCVDAYVAKVTKDNPKVTPVTSGGDRALRNQAKDLDKAIEGLFYDAGLYALNKELAADTAKFGVAFAKITTTDEDEAERPSVERVFPWEMLIDDEDAAYGKPRTWGQFKYVDRGVLQAMCPEHAEALEDVQRDDSLDDGGSGFDGAANHLLVIEMWHLPSGSKAGDGRHVIVCGDVVLEDEEYKKRHAPFEVLVMQRPTSGIFGRAIAKQLERIQWEINTLLQHIQLSQRLVASPVWMVQKGAKVNVDKMSNVPATVIEYVGAAPALMSGHASMGGDVYAHLDRLYAKAFEITGISQLSAQGLKPSGLDSGEAQRVYLDTQTERFKVAFAEYQDFHLRVAKQLVGVAGEVAKRNPKFYVKVSGKRDMNKVTLSEAWLDESEYILKLYPTNAFSSEPAARLAEISKFADAGWLDPKDAKRLLDFPDMEALASSENASYERTMRTIDNILDGKPYTPPDPFMDLAEACKLMSNAYDQGLNENVDLDRLDGLITWIQQAQFILNPPATEAPMPPDGMAPPMDPNASPMDPNTPPPMPGPEAMPGLPPGPPPPPGMG